MPFEIREQKSRYCVFTKNTDHNHGCHETREGAEAQMRALYANVPEARQGVGSGGKGIGDPTPVPIPYTPRPTPDYLITLGPAVKAMGGGKVGGYLVQWGDPSSADSDGEFFTAETDFDTEFPCKTSVYYHHGLDATIGRRRLGRGEMKLDDSGIWMEGQLDLRDAYLARIYAMAEAGKLGWSSGAVAHLTDPPRESPGGPIKCWPLKEASLTPIPSDRRNLAVAMKACPWPEFAEMTARAGLEPPELPVSLAEDLERAADYLERIRARCAGIKAGQKQFSHSRRERLARVRDELVALLEEMASPEAVAGEATPDSIDTPQPGPGEGTPASAYRLEQPFAGLPDMSDLYAAVIRQESGPLAALYP